MIHFARGAAPDGREAMLWLAQAARAAARR